MGISPLDPASASARPDRKINQARPPGLRRWVSADLDRPTRDAASMSTTGLSSTSAPDSRATPLRGPPYRRNRTQPVVRAHRSL